MPTPTYTPLANITLGSSAASVTFSSISQAYRDLVLVCNFTNSTGFVVIEPNATSASTVVMGGSGSAAESFTESNLRFFSSTSGSWTAGIVNIMDYSATDKHKTILLRSNDSTTYVAASAGRYASTSAVTSLVVRHWSSTMPAGSTFALYGIAS